MSDETTAARGSLPFDVLDQIDRACDRLEAAWGRGERPRLEDELGAVAPAHRAALLRDLLAVELAARRRRGEQPDPREYHGRFPGLGDSIAASFAGPPLGTPPSTRPVSGPAAESPEETAVIVSPTAPAAEPDPAVPDPPAGERVRYFGDFELGRVLGQGGMGVVYKARQISLNRPVALKMIRAGELADDDERRRFRNEAEAVASLDHPHIVPIYEVGEHDGRPYFSMRLVGGGSLAGRLAEFADPRAAARLVAEVAEAVDHAHRRGILHRDLKPANILLDEAGAPHVTDFGLAKRVAGDSGMTHTGAIVGTPSYMAPEQASGRRGAVTLATDVYGLGAVLYAVLAGRPPFTGDSAVETLEQVRERAPEPLSRRDRRVPRDLEVICLKCLEKDPARRYSTAQALADDLRRFLAGEPIAARPVGPLARSWMWCRRRPAFAGLAAALTLAVVAGVAGIAWQWRRAEHRAGQLAVANRELVAANAATKKAEQLADARLDRTMAAIQDYYTGVNEEVLREGTLPKALSDRLLAKPLEFYQQLTKELAARPDPTPREQDLLAEGRTNLGTILIMLGRIDEGRREYEASRTAWEDLAARHPDDPRFEKAPITALSNIVAALTMSGRWAEAGEPARKAIAGSKALVARHPDNLEYRGELARSQMNLGMLLSISDRLAEAVEAIREAATNFEAVVALDPDSPMYQESLGATRANLARVLGKQGRTREAYEEYLKAIAIREALAARHPELTDSENKLAYLHNEVGEALAAAGRPAEALAEFRKATAMSTSLAARQPQVPNYKMPLAMSHLRLGNALAATDRPAAVEAYRVAIQAFTDLEAKTPNAPGVRVGLGESYSALGAITHDPAQAADVFEKAIEAYESELARTPNVEPYREALALAESRLGIALAVVGKRSASAEAHRKAIAIRREIADRHPRGSAYRGWHGQAVGLSAMSLAILGDHDAATGRYREAIGILRPLLGFIVRDPTTVGRLGEQYHGLAASLRALGRVAEAADAARELARLSPRHPVLLYNTACELSLCGSIEPDPARKRSLADEAMLALRAAVAVGWSDGPHTSRDPDLDPLRDRDDFRRLLAELLDRPFPANPFARRAKDSL